MASVWLNMLGCGVVSSQPGYLAGKISKKSVEKRDQKEIVNPLLGKNAL